MSIRYDVYFHDACDPAFVGVRPSPYWHVHRGTVAAVPPQTVTLLCTALEKIQALEASTA